MYDYEEINLQITYSGKADLLEMRQIVLADLAPDYWELVLDGMWARCKQMIRESGYFDGRP